MAWLQLPAPLSAMLPLPFALPIPLASVVPFPPPPTHSKPQRLPTANSFHQWSDTYSIEVLRGQEHDLKFILFLGLALHHLGLKLLLLLVP